MNKEQFKEYEKALDIQQKLILQLNELKQKRNDVLQKVKQDRNIVEFDKQVLALELESEILLSKMQENFDKIKQLENSLKQDGKK